MSCSTRNAPLSPEMAKVLSERPYLAIPILPDNIQRFREKEKIARLSDDDLACGGAIEFREFTVPSFDGFPLPVLSLLPRDRTHDNPGLVFFHGGGMFSGDNRTGIQPLLEWVQELNLAAVSIGYRLAPENPHPTPVSDGYASVEWISSNRREVGFSNEPLIVGGASAGGGLAAAVALLSRDRGGPPISDQLLMCPMLDDRDCAAAEELAHPQVWDATCDRTAWTALLGDRSGAEDVPETAAPARATKLEGLPATFLDVGSAEIFRDEVIDYAARLARAGVATELHVWSGAFHGFDVLAPNTEVASAARRTRLNYLRRLLAGRAAA